MIKKRKKIKKEMFDKSKYQVNPSRSSYSKVDVSDFNNMTESFVEYLSKNLNISLSEAKLLESEVKRYSMLKEQEETPTEEQINQAKAYLGNEINSLISFFNNFFNKYDRETTKSNKEAIDTMSKIIINNDSNYIKYAYPKDLADVYNWLSSGIIRNRDKSLDEAFIKIFVDIIKDGNTENYFWVKPSGITGKYYSKIDFLLEIEKLIKLGGGVGFSTKFKQVFEQDLTTLLNPSFSEKVVKEKYNNFVQYLSKNLNISLSEAKLLESEVKRYVKMKEVSWKDIKNYGKKTMVAGALAGTMLGSGLSAKDVSSNKYNNTLGFENTVRQELSSDVLNDYQDEIQLEVFKNVNNYINNNYNYLMLNNNLNITKDFINKYSNSENIKSDTESILSGNLESLTKKILLAKNEIGAIKNVLSTYNSKDKPKLVDFSNKYKKLISDSEKTNHDLQKLLLSINPNALNESWKKAIATGLTTLMLTLPISKGLFGDSCNIDSKGEVVSCSRDALNAKKSVSDFLENLESGLKQTEDTIKNTKYREDIPDQIQAVKDYIEKIKARKDATQEQRNQLANILKRVRQLEQDFKKSK